jgi:hypothetical protein
MSYFRERLERYKALPLTRSPRLGKPKPITGKCSVCRTRMVIQIPDRPGRQKKYCSLECRKHGRKIIEYGRVVAADNG